jgi:hypothetical protein
MVFFITFLRAVAACLITNAHYTGIYPTDLIANGGLIGDIIFFAVSGYCLANIKMNFPRWYSKRVVRCYLPVLIMTAIYMLLGFYSLEAHNAGWWYVYPTYYHFVASIVVLYIPFYVILKIDVLKKHIPCIMGIIAIAYAVVYFVFYDKSYYHIDYVREPMIRFLFMESMLLGAYFKLNDKRFKDKFHWYLPLGSVIFFVLYFGSKLVFSRKPEFAQLQIINQFLIFVLLYFVFRFVMSIDGKLTKLPSVIKSIISFVAKMTLEIYVVQYVIIDLVRGKLPFPVNWLVITGGILVSATVLHYACEGILKLSYAIIDKAKKTSKKVTE